MVTHPGLLQVIPADHPCGAESGEPQLLHNMLVEKSGRDGKRWLIGIMIIVLTLGVLALAGPSWHQQSYPMMESISARVVALDLSRSMLVEDISPNRFTQAVAAAREIISSDFDGETGLVVFAGAAFVVSPLSRGRNYATGVSECSRPQHHARGWYPHRPGNRYCRGIIGSFNCRQRSDFYHHRWRL